MSALSERLSAALADRYRIERELGQGGMATVYLAHDLKHDRKVALKVLKPELAGAARIRRDRNPHRGYPYHGHRGLLSRDRELEDDELDDGLHADADAAAAELLAVWEDDHPAWLPQATERPPARFQISVTLVNEWAIPQGSRDRRVARLPRSCCRYPAERV
jgi:serine/threonine protein kinase